STPARKASRTQMERRTSVEIQAYSVDEAIRLALEELGLSRDEVDVEILVDASEDQEDEALVRVTQKGMAAQPTPRRESQPRKQGGGARLRGRRSRDDRPSRRGTMPRPAVVDRIDAEDEQVAKQAVRDLLDRMGVAADVMAVD